MQTRDQRFYSFQVQRNLDDLIQRGAPLNKKNILDAETINYKKISNELYTYDEFGFLDKYKDPNEIKK